MDPFSNPVGPDGADGVEHPGQTVSLEDDQFATAPNRPVRPDPVVIPGPGPFEAFAWLIGVIIVHLVASAIMVVLVAAVVVGISGDQQLAQDPGRLQKMINEHIGVVMGGDQVLFVLVVLLAVGLRLAVPFDRSAGPLSRLGNRLGRLRICPQHLLTIAVIVVPVSVACGQLFVAANRLWRGMLETLPGLPDVPAIQEVNVLATMAEGLSLPGMVFVLAVLPAVGEELVFRGVIGRGLVARGGVVHGIFLTSLLFAMAHINPAHAMSVFPLGVLLHVVHLATRSILAPILLHFLINGWAAVLTKATLSMPNRGIDPALLAGEEVLPWFVLVPASLASFCAVVYFWRSRIEFRVPGDAPSFSRNPRADHVRWWWPAYRSVEVPRGHSEAVRLKPPIKLTAALGVGLLSFYVALGWEVSRAVGGG